MMIVTDDNLLVRLQNKDASALNELMNRYDKTIRDFLKEKFGKRFLDDIVQETWLRLMEKCHLYEPGNFKHWLMTMAQNIALDVHRADKRYREKVQEAHDLAESDRREKENITPDASLEAAECANHLHTTINELPKNLREVMRLYYTTEQETGQIAAALGLSYACVCKRVARGKQLLGRRLKEYQCS